MHRPHLRLRAPSPGRRGGRALLLCAVVVAVAASGWLVVRDSSVGRVEHVYITGLVSPDEPRIRQALSEAAREMTTLNVREESLMAAVSEYPSVIGIETDADLPNKLSITVKERRAVATLALPGRRIPIAGNGEPMDGMRADRKLPVIKADRGADDPRVQRAVAVLAAAPRPLLRRSLRAWTDRRGLVVDLRQGPTLVFGDDHRRRAKWLAAARVLAEPSSRGAVYLDVRVPERVAAGGVATSTLTLDSTLNADASPLAQVQPD